MTSDGAWSWSYGSEHQWYRAWQQCSASHGTISGNSKSYAWDSVNLSLETSAAQGAEDSLPQQSTHAYHWKSELPWAHEQDWCSQSWAPKSWLTGSWWSGSWACSGTAWMQSEGTSATPDFQQGSQQFQQETTSDPAALASKSGTNLMVNTNCSAGVSRDWWNGCNTWKGTSETHRYHSWGWNAGTWSSTLDTTGVRLTNLGESAIALVDVSPAISEAEKQEHVHIVGAVRPFQEESLAASIDTREKHAPISNSSAVIIGPNNHQEQKDEVEYSLLRRSGLPEAMRDGQASSNESRPLRVVDKHLESHAASVQGADKAENNAKASSVGEHVGKDAANPWANFSSKRLAHISFGFDRGSMGSRERSASRPRLPSAPRSALGVAPERLSVMLHEAVEALMQAAGPDGTYVDCSFGRGGHSSEILRRLSPDGRLVAFDIDPTVLTAARAMERADPRFKCHHRPHGDLLQVVRENVKNLGGVLIDLQPPEDRSRGFSAVDDGPLDLRLNPGYGMSAAEWLQTVSVPELAWVIHEHGEDNDVIMSQRLAEGILDRQQRCGPYKSSLELADVCREVKQGLDDRGQHPAKLTFQAMRIFLNHEVEQLQQALLGAMERLQPGGRCVIISYRRKEAAQVKRFIREHEEADPRFASFVTAQRLTELYPLLATDHPWSCRQACEPVKPSTQECDRNPRSRPAVIHVLTKEERDFTRSPCRGLKPRPDSQQFKRPTPLPFQGAATPEVVRFEESDGGASMSLEGLPDGEMACTFE